jgi:hypothetical protein
VLLFCSLVGIYLLVYSSQPTSLDDQAVIAEAATLAQHGRPDINAIAYTEWLLPICFSGMGRLGVDGALYSKKEPFRALALLPLAVAARALPWLPARATAMLFNTLVTAAGALALYELTRRLKYRARTAVTLALLYGLTTFALVYAKTLFGEPLAALLLLVGLMAAYRYRQQPERHPALLAGALLGLAIGINNIYALLAPLVSFYMFGRSPRRLSHALSYLIPIAVCLGLLGLYNWARYGTPLQGGYEFAEGEGFTHAVLTGLYGLFLSPFRGLFWYNPVLLALPGWLMLRRRHARLAWLALALVAIQAVTFAAWWSWHGGIVWGPRFLLPMTPLFVLCLAPLVEAMWRQRALLVIVCAFAAVSASIQALGALFDASTYTNTYLNTHYWTGDAGAPVPMLADDVLYNPGLSPIVGHLALLYAGWPLHPAWLAQGVDWGHLLVSVALIGLGIWLASVSRSGAG